VENPRITDESNLIETEVELSIESMTHPPLKIPIEIGKIAVKNGNNIIEWKSFISGFQIVSLLIIAPSQ
jgi:hypothetical protein